MTSDNEETRNWTQLAAENKELHEQLDQARITIADYQRADGVAAAMAANNDVLRSVETRTYQTQGEGVGVDKELVVFVINHVLSKTDHWPVSIMSGIVNDAIGAWRAK